MEQPERLPQDDATLRSERAKKFFREFEKQSPDLAKQAEEFRKEAEGEMFWSDQQLAARFYRDEQEYQNMLDWFSVLHNAVNPAGAKLLEDDEAIFEIDFSEARALLWEDTGGQQGGYNKALKVRRLYRDLIAMGISREIFTESRYEAWKQSRTRI